MNPFSLIRPFQVFALLSWHRTLFLPITISVITPLKPLPWQQTLCLLDTAIKDCFSVYLEIASIKAVIELCATSFFFSDSFLSTDWNLLRRRCRIESGCWNCLRTPSRLALIQTLHTLQMEYSCWVTPPLLPQIHFFCRCPWREDAQELSGSELSPMLNSAGPSPTPALCRIDFAQFLMGANIRQKGVLPSTADKRITPGSVLP